MLSNAGLVNYFGRQVDMNNVVVSPLLMKKGTTQLAVYGIGALKEKMMHRLLRNNKVKQKKNKKKKKNEMIFY
jgi:double-strand break repair protein MRE11